MRIDYSEPKKSYTSSQASLNRPPNRSSASLATIIIIACLISSGIGFGSGWMLSQRSAKKGFKAAMEQQSLENSPRQPAAKPPPAKPQIIAPQVQDAPQPPVPGGDQKPPATSVTTPPPDQPLSFYKNLPSGQKNTVLGSGINTKDDKPAKQPLQAVIPTNFANQSPPKNADENSKTPAPATVEKTAGRQDAKTFTVQVASHSLKSDAETLKNKLSSKGYNVYIVVSNQGDKGTWYRVRVGKGLEQDAAKELANKLGKGAITIPDKE